MVGRLRGRSGVQACPCVFRRHAADETQLSFISGVSLPSQGFNNGVSRGIIFNSLSYPDTIDRIFDARLEPLDCHISEKPLGHACV